MKRFDFHLQDDESLILIEVLVNGAFEFTMALDTAATHSTFDRTALVFAGATLEGTGEVRTIETSGGIVQSAVFDVDSLEAIGHSATQFPVQVYDFLAHGIAPEYDGVLGLDFLKQKDLCIHFSKGYLTFQ